jgi:hypothetical protein
MANSLSGLTPTIIASAANIYLRRKSALLGRIRVEPIMESNLQAGGTSIVINKPSARRTPTTVSYTSPTTTDFTIPSITVNVTTHVEDRIKANELESRTAQGNFAKAFELTFGGMLDGLATKIDTDLTALYASAGAQVGTGGSAITDAVIRSAIQELAQNDVMISPDKVHFVTHPSNYWAEIMGLTNYNLALNVGRGFNQQTPGIQSGQVGNIYGVDFDYSNNIALTTLSSVDSTHNLMFERDGFVICFKKFESANTYGEPNVQEDIVTDPVTGITMRAQKFYDADLRTWVYALDVCYGIGILDADRIVEVLG